ncbi:SDR family oxidoreductase [Agromyces sp. LHK192]|uniref:SDR family oxidoreductase n=1 Tax=Agromyces sp. LHK192 TaxID=2498704 RepID=UPI000FDBD01A|nr:SDR family oxidoreductase [Agromyces sp. LHK192]
MAATEDPTTRYDDGPFPEQHQEQPGLTDETVPTPDHGEDTYVGHGLLTGRKALITGGDSGIGRAVAIAFAREGADVAIAFLPEEQQDAAETARLVEAEGRTAVLLPGDLREEAWNAVVVERTVDALGGLDLLVLNAAYQAEREHLADVTTDEFDRVMKTNLYSPFWLTRAAEPLLPAGASIIVTTSIQGYQPSPDLFDYAMTKAALVAFVEALAQKLGERGIRVNGVAPGPIWTPLIPATGWTEKVQKFGQDTPLGRAGQPAELAGAYVYLASEAASYVTGAILPVTGGKPL